MSFGKFDTLWPCWRLRARVTTPRDAPRHDFADGHDDGGPLLRHSPGRLRRVTFRSKGARSIMPHRRRLDAVRAVRPDVARAVETLLDTAATYARDQLDVLDAEARLFTVPRPAPIKLASSRAPNKRSRRRGSLR